MVMDSNINNVVYDAQFQRMFASNVVKIVTPASGVLPDVFERLMHFSLANVDLAPDLVAKDALFYANTHDIRLKQLKNALFDDAFDVLWALRGGYGCARLLDALSELTPPKKQKVFIGFSDNTALHLFLSQAWQWRTIHASGFSQLLDTKQDPANYTRLASLFETDHAPPALTGLIALNEAARRCCSVHGRLQGGNLTLVENSIGTHWQVNTHDTILFLEEVGEKGYRVDRSLLHLRQAGLLNHVNAIVFGECLSDDEKGVHVALGCFASDMRIPVYQTNQFGHGHRNYPLVYRAMSHIHYATDTHDYALTMLK
jgi:muramoyltetrapeptide carboxypeptidase